MLFKPNPTVTHVPMVLPVLVDKASFQQFVGAQATAVYTFCYRLLGSSHLAESAAQYAFLDASSRFPAITLADVLVAARRHCREYLRRGGEAVGETAVVGNQYLFNGLALPEREVLALYYGCQLSVTDIAAILNCSIETVQAILQQARRHAIDLLENQHK